MGGRGGQKRGAETVPTLHLFFSSSTLDEWVNGMKIRLEFMESMGKLKTHRFESYRENFHP